MRKLIALIVLFLYSCSTPTSGVQQEIDPIIRAADISALPTIESTSTTFYHNNKAENVVTTLANAGCNYIRLRVWYAPENNASSLAEVKVLSERVRKAGMKVWLTVHYSDTWADPGHQHKPVAWSNMNFAQLKTAVYDYTTLLMNELKPEIIQIGNETNDGMLWPEGKLSTNEVQYLALTKAASEAIRTTSTTTKIMLHFAGTNGADYYFNKVKSVDYDYIGISYYPLWHGKSLSTLESTLNQLAATYNKKVLIAETAYPFTLGYNDYTNNICGLQEQLISGFAATPAGQKEFLMALKSMTKRGTTTIGYCYWEPQWVAFRGPTSNAGSPWENQALWNFTNQSLPGLEFFSK